jgi:hypothetical protein
VEIQVLLFYKVRDIIVTSVLFGKTKEVYIEKLFPINKEPCVVPPQAIEPHLFLRGSERYRKRELEERERETK